MVKYKIKVKKDFTDIKTGATVHNSTIFETEDKKRLLNILRQDLGEIAAIEHPKKPGGRIMIHQNYCYIIGGIETANRQIARAFSDKNIVFCFGKGDQDQMLEIGKYCDVIVDDGVSTYDVDVLIMSNYDSAQFIIDRVKARKVYQQIHADFENLTKMKEWQHFKWIPNSRIDKVLAVSETAQDGLKNAFGIDSVVVPNVLTAPLNERLVFMVLSRASREKGIERVLELANRMDAAGKDFVIFVSSTVEQCGVDLSSQKRIVLVKPSLYNEELLRAADYLIQLSLNESYCFSVREALRKQIPVIVSDIPEFRKLVKDGKNGYILNDDFSNLDIDKIFNNVPKFDSYDEEVPAIWDKVLKGEL